MKTDIRGVPVTGADQFRCCATRRRSTSSNVRGRSGRDDRRGDRCIAGVHRRAPVQGAGAVYAGRAQVRADGRGLAEDAKRHATRANLRERGLIAATDKLIAGDWHGASQTLDRVLTEFPRDAFTLQIAHLMDFFRGDTLNLRNRISRVLPDWDATVPGYSYVLGMHAFGLEEMNQYPEAEATARRALGMQPRDGWAVHAAVHVMEMQGRIEEGIEFLLSREPDWAPDNASRSTTSGISRCSTWTPDATSAHWRCSIRRSIRSRRRTCCRSSTPPRCCGA